MAITRDDVVHDRIRARLQSENASGAGHSLLNEAEFEGSRQRILAEMAAHDELWIFGYGSLIWSPTFEFVDSGVAEITGLARRFCLWAHTGRGSRERPGLWLALDAGTHCTGIAFRVANEHRDYETLMLWRREMVSGAYRPTVRSIKIAGQTRACICLEANKAHDRYAAALSESDIVDAIAFAYGHLGTCREYLFNVVDKLASVGVRDAELDALVEQVRRRRAAPTMRAPLPK